MFAFRFSYDVVYTNHQAAGAYRGYGATQGIFALETIVNELAEQLGMDPTAIRNMNMVREGMTMPAYYNEVANACALDRCMEHCSQMFGWEEKYPVRDMGNGTEEEGDSYIESVLWSYDTVITIMRHKCQ